MSGEEKWDMYYGDKFNEPKPETLQDKIDAIKKRESFSGNWNEKIVHEVISYKEVNKAIQELIEAIDIEFPDDTTKKGRQSIYRFQVKQILDALIGEKK